jgi:hypothetical protein
MTPVMSVAALVKPDQVEKQVKEFFPENGSYKF